jgi:hypothetical protein
MLIGDVLDVLRRNLNADSTCAGLFIVRSIRKACIWVVLISPSTDPEVLTSPKFKRSETDCDADFPPTLAALEAFLGPVPDSLSNRTFKLRSSSVPCSSIPSPISLPTKEDMPNSNCSSGKATFPESCKYVRVEKAALAHSAIER